MNDLDKAKELLRSGGYTCVLCKEEKVYTSFLRGVEPMTQWLQDGTDLREFSAADKVVGKASAMLFALAGVKEVYAPVMSEGAVKTFSRYGIPCVFDTLAGGIINRSGTGPCPMEAAVRDIEEPPAALDAILRTQKLMKTQTGAAAE